MEQIDPIIISLRNHQNQAYTGLLGVGPHLFRVSFHTGMKGIWIPGRIHRVPNQVHAYHGAVSPTYNEAPGTLASIRLRNGAVTISGRRRTEHMMLGPMGNLVMVGPQEFVVCRRVVPRQFYINLPYDGFVGLGLPLPANIDAVGAAPIWMTLMNQGLLRSNLFSLYLRNYHFHGNDGGRLIFGGVSQEHYEGHHQYFDLVDNSNQWKIHMYSVSVAGHLAQYCDKVLIDSGCEYIYGPPHIIYRINRQILGREVPLYGPTILTHDEAVGILEWPHVSFNFIEGDEDASLTIPPQNYVIADADGRYISTFRPLVFQPGDEAYFVLGLPWLRRYHTVFDFGQERIGFALAVQ